MRMTMVSAVLTLTACGGGAATCVAGQDMDCTCASGASGKQTCGGDFRLTACACSSQRSPKRIFITATSYASNLGGLAGADEKCNTSAQGALLSGTWKAWLSDDTTNAIDRIADVGPWVDTVGATIFNNKANLATVPLNPIHLTEQGTSELSWAWTGTDIGGTRSGYTCAGWTPDWFARDPYSHGKVGDGSPSSSKWTAAQLTPCVSTNSLYCLEQ